MEHAIYSTILAQKNSMDRGAGGLHGVAKSWTQITDRYMQEIKIHMPQGHDQKHVLKNKNETKHRNKPRVYVA